MPRARSFVVVAAILGSLAMLTEAQGKAGPLRIEGVDAGHTQKGHPWFRVRLNEPYPPARTDSWFASVTLASRRGEYQYSVRQEGGRWDRRFIDRQRRPEGEVTETVLADGSFVVVLPIKATPADRFVVQVGTRAGNGVVVDALGTRSEPLRLGRRVADPLALFGPVDELAPQPVVEPSPQAPLDAAESPAARDTGSRFWVVLAGTLLGVAAFSLTWRRNTSGTPPAALALLLGLIVGSAAAAVGSLRAIEGATIGLAAGFVLAVARGAAARRMPR